MYFTKCECYIETVMGGGGDKRHARDGSFYRVTDKSY